MTSRCKKQQVEIVVELEIRMELIGVTFFHSAVVLCRPEFAKQNNPYRLEETV